MGGMKCNTWPTTPLYFLGVPPKGVNLILCVCVCFVLTTQVDSTMNVNL